MKITFEDCIARKKIFRFKPAEHLVKLEIEDAKSDLRSAQDEFSKSGFKWATIKGYYSMFHSARALLYSRGYRERGHYCLYLAIKEFFVKEKKLDPQLAEDLKSCMDLREEALPKILQGLTQSYSYYYRRVYGHSGYVYQNRTSVTVLLV